MEDTLEQETTREDFVLTMDILNPSETDIYTEDIKIHLDSSIEDCRILYTLNGEHPFSSNYGSIEYYPEDGFLTIKNRWSGTITLKAVAFTDDLISNTISESFKIVNMLSDDDHDGLPNYIEDAPLRDTDEDGIPDYLDRDSDNDGLPDCKEKCRDLNNNGIPDYIDLEVYKELIYRIDWTKGFPESVVPYVNYYFSIKVRNGSGMFKLETCEDGVLGLDDLKKGIHMSEGDRIPFSMYLSACTSTAPVVLRFIITDDYTGESHIEEFSFTVVTENSEYPYRGIRITWDKNKLASYYNIYKNGKLLCKVPHDSHSIGSYQYYIDRDGNFKDQYSVSFIDKNNIESQCSLPKHAPDIFDNICLVQGNIADLTGSPEEGIPVAVRVKQSPSTIGNTLVLKGTNLVYTDTRGYFEFKVPKNSIVNVVIDDAGFNKSLVIPDVSSIDIEELLKHPQNRLGY